MPHRIEDEKKIEWLMNESGCEKEYVMLIYNKANKNPSLAMEMLRQNKGITSLKEYNTQLNAGVFDVNDNKNTGQHFNDSMENMACAIVKYQNGLLVGGIFYDYSQPGNLELLRMLERGEFDKDILKTEEEEVTVKIEEKKDEVYKNNTEDGRSGSNKGRKEEEEMVKRFKKENIFYGRRISPFSRKLHLNLPDITDLTNSDQKGGKIVFKVCDDVRDYKFIVPDECLVGDVMAYLNEKIGCACRLSSRGELLDENESALVLNRCSLEIYLNHRHVG